MPKDINAIVDALTRSQSLTEGEYAALIRSYSPELAAELARRAVAVRQRVYGRDVYVRGLIEISSCCKNDCLYCGLRRSNRRCQRYRLTPEEILTCAREGYALGFRTFVLQGGEDGYYTDALLCPLIGEIKAQCPGSAVTLSLGERGRESFTRLREAGADRYLLRHETADEDHYAALHPPEMSFSHRMACLRDLKALGYQVGCGFMVGTPGQRAEHLARDLKFIETLRPQMCGIGPFLPHHDTPFRDCPPGSAELTCFLLSVIRLMLPAVLLPATTALGTRQENGRELGILAGANVVMPNLSPASVLGKYELYDNKLTTGAESAACLRELEGRMEAIGYRVVSGRGDAKTEENQ